MKNITTNIAKALVVAGALLSFAAVASAWTGPTLTGGAVAPANNVSGLINTSSGAQTKTGTFETVGGLLVDGGSALVGHTDIGPWDCIYHGGTTSTCESTTSGTTTVSGSLQQYFASNTTKSLIASAFNALKPDTAYATTAGTPAGDALHVNGNTSINGTLLVNDSVVCFVTACGPLHLSGTDTSSPDMRLGAHAIEFNNDQGGSIELGATNTTANASGNVPYIDFHFGTGTVQDYNTRLINSANGQLEVDATNFLMNSAASVQNGMNIDNANTSDGTLSNGLTFGSGSGEGITSGRTSSSYDQYGLDFYTNYNDRMQITNSGAVNIPGSVNVQQESHFSNGAYVDPEPGVATSIKSNSLATGSLYVAGEVPIYLDNCDVGGVVTLNPTEDGCGHPSLTNPLRGYLIPAAPQAIDNVLGAHVTGYTLGGTTYHGSSAATTNATISFTVDGGSHFAVTNEWIHMKSGANDHYIQLTSSAVQPGSSGSVTLSGSTAGGQLQCSPDTAHVVGYSIWVDLENSNSKYSAAGSPFEGTSSSSGIPAAATYPTSIGVC